MISDRSQKLLIAAGLVLVIVLIFYGMRLNERMDREEGRAAYANGAAQCSSSCQASFTTARRRCSAHSYEGTREWCRDQARSVRSSCMARCQS